MQIFVSIINEMAGKSIVSFDFDGTLHSDVIHGHPIDFWETNLTPNLGIIKKLKDESKNHDIVIVSARDPWNQSVIKTFVTKYHLPVKKIYTTGLMDKLPILKSIHSIRHYDDNLALKNQLEKSGIQFVPIKNDSIEKFG